MNRPVRITLISGSLRTGSGNSAVVRTAAAVAPDGVEGTVYDGMGDLPHFNPDDDREPLHPAVAALRTAIAAADAVLFCTPEYAGALPGSFKNLLDWTVGGAEMYGRPVAWINASGPPARPAGPTRTPRCARCSATWAPTSSRRPACGSRCPATRSAPTA